MADHLFSPDEPSKPIRIEYHGPLYDGGDWDEYPTRHGWESEPGIQKFPEGQIPQESQPTIECWLYFGMLHCVFGDQLNQCDFLLRESENDDEGQQQYITTKHLERYVGSPEKWQNDGLGARTFGIVRRVWEHLPRYNRYIRAEMCFAIRLACQALWTVAEKRDGPQTDPGTVKLWLFPRDREAEQMVRGGWCPLDAEKCRKIGVELDTPAYLVQLLRTKPAWNKRTHERCKKTECVADNVDESLYVTRHLQENCMCEHLHANVEKLHEVLLDGGIPLVQITPRGEDELDNQGYEINIVKKRVSKRYVAVSHRARLLLTDKEYVPQYGIGPFRPLQSAAARFAHVAGKRRGDNSVLVWIDTLCIPHEHEVRSLAIQRIRDVYVGAYRTMLLDSEIKQVDPRSASDLELVLRVLYCSGWIRRLWTLQEGLAAKSRLYVILSDKAVNISTIADELFAKLSQGKLPIFQEKIARYAAGVWYQYFQGSIEYASKFDRFVNVVTGPYFDIFVDGDASISQFKLLSWNWYNVATRAASKDGDRVIVLAGVLNLDVKKILKVKGTDGRMWMLYAMLREFPTDVLFHDEPRFEFDGGRWAIKVCRFTEEIRYLTGGVGYITPWGLHVTEYRSWIFPSRMVFDLRRIDDDDFQQVWEQWLTDCHISFGGEGEVLHLRTKVPINFKPDGTHGIIVKEYKHGRPSTTHPCVSVSLKRVEKDVHYARYDSLGTVKAFTIGVSSLPDEGYLVGGTWDDLQKRDWVVG
ncbi:hypothetical protein CNMCM7691_008258 [Aspergillus felis]|uniref:Heterokaryon incompatibility domain-containing protein n=1 Tax=Aspergillus felis TaxID=1287682 RepID=A0A8H6QTD4_9EURO|nr:hypothetical protein CNMCM7691_008258 [Aspergillus felis]